MPRIRFDIIIPDPQAKRFNDVLQCHPWTWMITALRQELDDMQERGIIKKEDCSLSMLVQGYNDITQDLYTLDVSEGVDL